jgi:hypothetical protein
VGELPRTLATHLLAPGESAALMGESMSSSSSSALRRARAPDRAPESFEQAVADTLSID